MNRVAQLYVTAVICTLIAGMLLFAVMNHWIIIRLPFVHGYSKYIPEVSNQIKKQIELHYFHDGSWHIEKVDILWSETLEVSLENLIRAWLSLMEEEKIMGKKITLEDVALDAKKSTAYISLDRSPFSKQGPLFQKWMLLEGLLKTIAHSGLSIGAAQLLVHHQILNDPHLDLSRAWPIQGFV